MKTTSRILIITLVVVLAFIIFSFMYFVNIGPILNDRRAENVKRQLLSIELPEKTKIVDSYAYAGNTSGTGNHIEIWAGILIKTDLDAIAVEKHFDGLNIFDANKPYKLKEWDHFNFLKEINDYTGYYIIYKYADAFTRWDIRKG